MLIRFLLLLPQFCLLHFIYLGRPQNDLVTVWICVGWCACTRPRRCVHACSPSHLLIAPLPFSVSLPPAPYVSVSLPLSSVISIWCILAAVVGSLFSMWAGLISVLWWQMQWLICFHGIMNVPKSQLHLDGVFAIHAIKKVQLGLHIIFFGLFCFSTTQSATQTPTWSELCLKHGSDLHPSLFFFRTWAQPTCEPQLWVMMRPFNACVGGNMCRAIDFSVSRMRPT